MLQVGLIGVAAGIAGALLFLSPTGGTALAFPLFAMCGLPIAIAGLGWSLLAAAIATGVAGVTIASALSLASAAIYIALFAGPILWMCRLAALSRQGEDGGATEYFPIGGILFQGSIAIALGVVVVGIIGGFDPESLTTELTDALAVFLAQSPDVADAPTSADVEPLARFLVLALPFILPAYLIFIHVFTMWLASRIADASGRLIRPRDKLWTASMPQRALLVFAAVFVVSFLPGSVGQVAATVTGALAAAFALIGLAVIHAVTVDNALRILILVAVYVLIFIFGLPLLLLAILGLAEGFLQLRARRFGSGAPPNQ